MTLSQGFQSVLASIFLYDSHGKGSRPKNNQEGTVRVYPKTILMCKEKKKKQKPSKTIATKADVAWNLPCEDVPQCLDFFLQAVVPSQALRKLSICVKELTWQVLGKRSPDLCPDWWCSCCCVSWCVICDSDPNSFQSGPFAFLSLVSAQLVYSFEEKKLFFLVTPCLRVYLSAEIALINPQDKYRNKQIKGEEEGQEKVWQGKTWGVGQVFILQLLLWVIAVVDLFFPQWFL